jgi:cyclase
MLAKRIIPCLDIKNGRVVKGVNFINLRDAGDPVENALTYEKEGADELVFLDITASNQHRSTTIDLVRKVAQVVFMPFTVGGGVKTADDFRALLLAGADKVSINTAAVNRPRLITEGAKVFGSQCVVVAIDAKRRTMDDGRRTKNRSSLVPCEEWEVFIHGGRTPTGLDVVEWAKRAQALGAGEILLTSMDFDGTRNGFDLALTHAVSSAVKIPVIASGGAGNNEHFFEVFKQTKATAVLAASVFHYRQINIGKLKKYLNQKNIEVRLA